MKNRFFRKTLLYITTLTLLLVVFTTISFNVIAEEPPEDPSAEEYEWFVNGNGTYFEITNSEYLNITLTSSENVNVYLESSPKVISYYIKSNCSATTTSITLTGFESNKTYYQHQDGILIRNFTTDASGSFSYSHDLTMHHHIFIQDITSTITILPNGDIDISYPWGISIMRDGNKYYLEDDIIFPYQHQIIIQKSDMVLDGQGHQINIGYQYPIYMANVQNVTIKNFSQIVAGPSGVHIVSSSYITIKDCFIGWGKTGIEVLESDHVTINKNKFYYIGYGGAISIRDGHWATINDNIIKYNTGGVSLWRSHYAIVTENIISDNDPNYGVSALKLVYCWGNAKIINNTISNHDKTGGSGIYTDASGPILIHGNAIINNLIGIYFSRQWGSTVTCNTISNAYRGVTLYNCVYGASTFYHNNFIDNTEHFFGYDLAIWDNGAGEGNYWDDYTGLDDGSNGRTADDGIGDTIVPHPYVNYGGGYYQLDNYPLMMPWTLNWPQPIANAGGPYQANQGEIITLDASGSSDPNEDPLQYRWDFRNDGVWDTVYSSNSTFSHAYYYSGWVKVEVFDGEYSDTATSYVTVPAESRTYTLDVDFDEGNLIGLEHETVHDQLQIHNEVEAYPVLWIANSGEDTISKWDTDANKEVARYHTWFGEPAHHDAWTGPSPSRTCVDKDGNCYVANRHFDGLGPDVIKISVDEWFDHNGDGNMDTSFDGRNGGLKNGFIEPEEMMPMFDTGPNINVIDPVEIVDERIEWAVRIVHPDGGGIGRSLSIDPDGYLWLGLYDKMVYYKLNPDNGSIVDGPINVSPHTPYGSLVDRDGILWGASLGTNLLRLDTKTKQVDLFYHNEYGNNYGIALGYEYKGYGDWTTQVYLGSSDGHTFIKFDSATNIFNTPAAAPQYHVCGIATDSEGNIVAGDATNGEVSKFTPTGARIWGPSVAIVPSEVRGIAVDANDDVWLIHRLASKLSKFDKNGRALLERNSGLYPYTYSDAVGVGFKTANPGTYGAWTESFDCGITDAPWGKVSWNSYEPAGTSVTVKVRSSHDQYNWSHWEIAHNGITLSSTPNGRYLQIKTILENTSGDSSPIIYDLTVETISNAPPVSNANGPYIVNEGEIITFDASNSTDPDNDPLQYRWDFDNNSIWDTNYSTNPTATYTWYDDYTGSVTVEVFDGEETDTGTTTVIVNNVAPTADAGVNKTGDEPSTFIFTGSHIDPGTLDTHIYEWDFDYDGVTFDIEATGNNVIKTWEDDFIGIVALRITDDDGSWHIDTCTVTVDNVAPTIEALILPLEPVQISTPVDLTATFTDPGLLDTHISTIDWDDGNITTGTITGSGGTYIVTDSWIYRQPGVYTINITVEDDDGGYDIASFQYVVIYDPSSGFVTGGGWIMSPEGAYTPNPTITGKANFGFVAKYKKGHSTPDGNTEFNFKVANLNFHSNDYEWLVIQIAGAKAMYKGTGTINGEGNYGFKITAIDEELTQSANVDLFRIKIWDKDNNDLVIYDNQLGADDNSDPTNEIGGGNIKIHEG